MDLRNICSKSTHLTDCETELQKKESGYSKKQRLMIEVEVGQLPPLLNHPLLSPNVLEATMPYHSLNHASILRCRLPSFWGSLLAFMLLPNSSRAQTNLPSPLMRVLCRTESEASMKSRQITSITSPLSHRLPFYHRRKLSWFGMIHSSQNLVCFSELCSSLGARNTIFWGQGNFFQYLLDCYH